METANNKKQRKSTSYNAFERKGKNPEEQGENIRKERGRKEGRRQKKEGMNQGEQAGSSGGQEGSAARAPAPTPARRAKALRPHKNSSRHFTDATCLMSASVIPL